MAAYDAFIERFPEFAGADQKLVQAKLDEATRQLDVAAWNTLADDGIYLLAAQKLARSPTGNAAKLVSKDGSTVYDDELEELRRQVASGRGIT